MMGALLEVLAEAAMVIGVLALAWNLASVIATRRYLRRRPTPRRSGVVVRFVRPERKSS